jgi:hypothetical protein
MTASSSVHQATTEGLGELSRRVQMRARIGVTNRYGQGAYPLAELATTKSFGHLRPYLKVSNITNTGYEEVEGVRMPGRAYFWSLIFAGSAACKGHGDRSTRQS